MIGKGIHFGKPFPYGLFLCPNVNIADAGQYTSANTAACSADFTTSSKIVAAEVTRL